MAVIPISKTLEQPPEKPVIFTMTLPLADTWYEILNNEDMRKKIKSWMLKARGGQIINYSFQSGGSNPIHYMTIPAGSILSEDTRPEYISVKSPTANTVVELEYWIEKNVTEIMEIKGREKV